MGINPCKFCLLIIGRILEATICDGGMIKCRTKQEEDQSIYEEGQTTTTKSMYVLRQSCPSSP